MGWRWGETRLGPEGGASCRAAGGWQGGAERGGAGRGVALPPGTRPHLVPDTINLSRSLLAIPTKKCCADKKAMIVSLKCHNLESRNSLIEFVEQSAEKDQIVAISKVLTVLRHSAFCSIFTLNRQKFPTACRKDEFFVSLIMKCYLSPLLHMFQH